MKWFVGLDYQLPPYTFLTVTAYFLISIYTYISLMIKLVATNLLKNTPPKFNSVKKIPTECCNLVWEKIKHMVVKLVTDNPSNQV